MIPSWAKTILRASCDACGREAVWISTKLTDDVPELLCDSCYRALAPEHRNPEEP